MEKISLPAAPRGEYRKIWGMTGDQVGIKHYRFQVGPASYPFGVLVEKACHAHPWGSAIRVEGEWYWRDGDAILQPLPKGLVCLSGMKCTCGA